MAYDDDKYIKASEELDDAVYELLDNEIGAAEIHDLVDNAIRNHVPQER